MRIRRRVALPVRWSLPLRWALPLALALLAGCSKSDTPAPSADTVPPPPGSLAPKTKKAEPDHIEVDHILIGVENLSAGPGKFSGKWAAPKAKTIAYDLLGRLKAGGDWAQAKKEYTEDPPPGGPYKMANFGSRPAGPDEFPRGQMAPAFGNVGFQLDVGEIGIADYDTRNSPFGFHIIKRIK